jgi:hypothetical protein
MLFFVACIRLYSLNSVKFGCGRLLPADSKVTRARSGSIAWAGQGGHADDVSMDRYRVSRTRHTGRSRHSAVGKYVCRCAGCPDDSTAPHAVGGLARVCTEHKEHVWQASCSEVINWQTERKPMV